MQNYMSCQNPDIKKKVNLLSRPINNATYYSENSYMWLLKPTGLNRGRGIEIFDSLEELEKKLLDFLAMMNRKKLNKEKNDKNIEKEKETRDVREPERMSVSKELIEADTTPVAEKPFFCEKFKLNTCSFVIQKYV